MNLPVYQANIRTIGGTTKIFDILRRKFVALTPEEWVRQNFVHYLIEHKGYSQTLMANEVSLTLNGMTRRCDTVLYTQEGLRPRMIIEYKRPDVEITQRVFNQICRYNQKCGDDLQPGQKTKIQFQNIGEILLQHARENAG